MKRAGELAFFISMALLLAGCIVELEKVVPNRASSHDVIDLRDPVGGSLWAQGTVYFGRLEAPVVLNWAPEDVFVKVPEGLPGEEVWVHVDIYGLKSNPMKLSLLETGPLFRIMCFGDSIIYAGVPEAMQGMLDEDPYLRELEPVVINQGKSMELVSADATTTRLANALDFHDLELVILLEGANDVRDSKQVPAAAIRDSVRRMVDEVRFRGLDLILCTLLPRVGDCGDVESPTTEEHNTWLAPYAAGLGIPLVDLYQEFVSTPGWQNAYFDADDCIHPNEQGKSKIAELLTAKIEEIYLAACTDIDGDGYGDPTTASCPSFGRDCDDRDPDVHPATIEQACTNGIDDDCDGLADGLDPDCRTPGSCADPAQAAVSGTAPVYGARGLLSRLALFLLPAGLAVAWRGLRRKGRPLTRCSS